jgi:hypothetical protein
MFHPFDFQHFVGKTLRVWGLASWLIESHFVGLAPTNYTSCSVTNLDIRTPTYTLCVFHQNARLFARPFTPSKWVGCMCVDLGGISNND